MALATLEQTSVRMEVKRMTIIRSTGIETSPNSSNSIPIHADNPEYSNASAIANPEPRSRRTAQGTLDAVNFQLKRVSYLEVASFSGKSSSMNHKLSANVVNTCWY